MSKQAKNTIKNWFKNGSFPNQFHFWDWMDSFFHKDEQIPASQIDSLQDLLDAKVDRKDLPDGEMAMDDISGLNSALDGKVDKEEGKALSSEDFTTTLKDKLEAVDENANNYQHPATHSVDIINETEEKSFISSAEKQSLNDHFTDQEIHKSSAQIRSEIEDTDLPISIARQSDVVNSASTVVNTIRDGVDEAYNTLKKVYDWIFVHDGNAEIHKTSEQIRSEIVDADIPESIARLTDISVSGLQEVTEAGATSDQNVTLSGEEVVLGDIFNANVSVRNDPDNSFEFLQQSINMSTSEVQFLMNKTEFFVSSNDFETGNFSDFKLDNSKIDLISPKISVLTNELRIGLNDGSDDTRIISNRSLGSTDNKAEIRLHKVGRGSPEWQYSNNGTDFFPFAASLQRITDVSGTTTNRISAASFEATCPYQDAITIDNTEPYQDTNPYGITFTSRISAGRSPIARFLINPISKVWQATTTTAEISILNKGTWDKLTYSGPELSMSGQFSTSNTSPLGSAPGGSNATSGHVLTADGSGGSSWEAASSGGFIPTLQQVTEQDASTDCFVNITGDFMADGENVILGSEDSGITASRTQVQLFSDGGNPDNYTSLTLGTDSPGNIQLSAKKLIVQSNEFRLGDGSQLSNKILRIYNGNPDAPELRYNETTNTWQFSNDGLTFFDLGSSGSIPTLQEVTTGGASTDEYTTFLGGVGSSKGGETRFGYNAAQFSSSGTYWTALGSRAGYSSVSGSNWTAIGNDAGLQNKKGLSWTAVGSSAGRNSLDSGWTAVGSLASQSNVNGRDWVSIGYAAAANLVDGSSATDVYNSVHIGYKTRVSANGITNENVFGYKAEGKGSNTVSLGNASISNVYAAGTFNTSATSPLGSAPGGTNADLGKVLTANGAGGSSWEDAASGGSTPTLQDVTDAGSSTTNNIVIAGTATASNFILSSDESLKTFKDDELVAQVDEVKIRKFTFNDDKEQRTRHGVSAQKLQKVAPEMVYEEADGTLKVGYIDFLLAKVANQDDKIEELEKKINSLMKTLEAK